MAMQSISLTAADPKVKVRRIGGNLQVEGWDKPELEASGDPAAVERDDQAITISCSGDLVVKVPRQAVLQVDFVGRALEVLALQGPVDISFVGGDVNLRDLTGQVTFHGLVGGATRMDNVSRVATAGGVPGPFGVGAGEPWIRAERFAGRAEEQRRKIAKKILKAEQKLNRIRVGPMGGSMHWKWGVMAGNNQTSQASEPVSDDERMAIMRMLQEKKITAEEADRLLAALEGES